MISHVREERIAELIKHVCSFTVFRVLESFYLGNFANFIFCGANILGYKTHPEFKKTLRLITEKDCTYVLKTIQNTAPSNCLPDNADDIEKDSIVVEDGYDSQVELFPDLDDDAPPFRCERSECVEVNSEVELQWATKVVETLLGNDAFRYLSSCSILFASSVNSLIPPAPNSMLCRRCGLCSRTNRKLNVVSGGRGKMSPRCSKIQFYYQVYQHFCRPL